MRERQRTKDRERRKEGEREKREIEVHKSVDSTYSWHTNMLNRPGRGKKT